MKKIKFFSLGLLLTVSMTTMVFNSYSQNTNTTDEGVIINGVKWATRNVDSPGTFAASPESAGKFYQWNRKNAWNATGPVTGWNSSTPSGTSWAKANDPSPEGWRFPTVDEIKTLLDKEKVTNEWISKNGVNGRIFTDKTTGNSIFLPAAGTRDVIGNPNGRNRRCECWSGTAGDASHSHSLTFTDLGAWEGLSYRPDALTIRCVSESSNSFNKTGDKNSGTNEPQTQNAVKNDMIGKKFNLNSAEKELGMFYFCGSGILEDGKSSNYELYAFSKSNTNFQSKNLRIFLLKTENYEDYIIVDELLFDKNTTDTFGCESVYNKNKGSGDTMFVRYKRVKNNPVLVNVYECKSGKIITKTPPENLKIQFYEP